MLNEHEKAEKAEARNHLAALGADMNDMDARVPRIIAALVRKDLVNCEAEINAAADSLPSKMRFPFLCFIWSVVTEEMHKLERREQILRLMARLGMGEPAADEDGEN